MKPDKILVDTSIWINALRKGTDKTLKKILESLLLEQRVAITELNKLEILSGAPDKQTFNDMLEDLEALWQLEFVPEIWHSASKHGFTLKVKGIHIPNTDLLLSATAIYYGCPLWHQDKHFDLINQHIGLMNFSPKR